MDSRERKYCTDVNDLTLESAVTAWVGTGTIPEFGNGLERVVILNLGAAGAHHLHPIWDCKRIYIKSKLRWFWCCCKSGISVTDLDQVYPYDGSGTLNVSGTTTTPYNRSISPVIKNVELRWRY